MVEVLIIGGPDKLNLEMLQLLLVARKETPFIIVSDADSENLLDEIKAEEKLTEVVAFISKCEEPERIELLKTKGVNSPSRGLFGISKRANYKLKNNGKRRERRWKA